ncbi:GatB/YqeY domain-containing protein [Niveispirillum cyanobacteriorum]|uniref:Glutamyl-tRNA amidotransferase n=1 Tax=Niveispirillum cyanobacteriorum TaxID=1612173 RepID=A0A2K9NA40_9PROT|nr:GatB/YqeY domain-containing protein [Niveispirillum cyanobacteriorum]AUN29947.1 glutamyl-tRNA amidotransferase [Niveispirillum cyanobacteriorum]GGE59271.1 aspartyl-tRNA amidotransferase subunit B [Niveispirillum cyanobacteriorum]
MLRQTLNEALKDAMRAKNSRGVATLRLILAALKDRDIAARTSGNQDGIDDAAILSMLQTMVKQRRESIIMYEQGGRTELAQQEKEEIDVIEAFLPRQLNEDDTREAIAALIAELGATGVKDMGKVMAELRGRFAGQMDFTKASALVREKLAN